MPASVSDMPRRVSITGMNVAKLSATRVRVTTIRYRSVSGFLYGSRARNPDSSSRPPSRSMGGTRDRTSASTASAGIMRNGVQCSP